MPGQQAGGIYSGRSYFIIKRRFSRSYMKYDYWTDSKCGPCRREHNCHQCKVIEVTIKCPTGPAGITGLVGIHRGRLQII